MPEQVEKAVIYCEPIYDLDQGLGPDAWAAFGQVCKDSRAVLGDTYVTYNPYAMIPDWTYYFLLNAPGLGFYGNPGQGYYPITD